MRFLPCCFLFLASVFLVSVSVRAAEPSVRAAEPTTYLLQADLSAGDVSEVVVTLEVGGESLYGEAGGIEKEPLSVSGEFRYTEQLLKWSDEMAGSSRSLRHYRSATAKIQKEQAGVQPTLSESASGSASESTPMVVAEIRAGKTGLNGAAGPLTRGQYDLINLPGNTLALNHLLPGRALKEGESWDHDAATIGALLGMDHVAVCEVRSVVTGDQNNQVQIRMAGTVHGTIDGAPTEMHLRGAYLFHLRAKRITKLNLAIQEKRTGSPIVPGLDVVAKVSISVKPSEAPSEAMKGMLAELGDQQDASEPLSEPLSEILRYEAAEQGFRFLHDRCWYVTAEQRDQVSLGCLQKGDLTARCSITTLPARSEGRATSLEQYERDVRTSVGEPLETVVASTQWTTAEGHACLGVVAHGSVKGVPLEWRYYLVSAPGLPRVSLSVTVEQSRVEQFGDTDRQIVDSLELLQKAETASKGTEKVAR